MPDKGRVELAPELCKGCGLCIQTCVPKLLRVSDRLNHLGYAPVEYSGAGCSGCGLCFYVCPEPGAIRVFKRVAA